MLREGLKFKSSCSRICLWELQTLKENDCIVDWKALQGGWEGAVAILAA
jgi:hypothetical protein